VKVELWVQSLGNTSWLFVKINNSPQLIVLTISLLDINCLSFNIFATSNIKSSSVSEVDKASSFNSEQLPPSSVSAPDLHVFCSARTLNVKGLVVIPSSDGQGLLMEVPDLSLSSVWSLDYHVPIVNKIKIFVTTKC